MSDTTGIANTETPVETRQLLICGRWPLTLQPGLGGHYAYLDTASRRNNACFLSLLDNIPTGLRVAELFGGVGMFTTIIQHVLQPERHWASDLDVDCAAQLASLEFDNLFTNQADAKRVMGAMDAQVVVLDFPVGTFRDFENWPWMNVFIRRPRYLIWSDTALRRLGLHRELYSKAFGTKIVNQHDYVHAYSRFLSDKYGYRVTKVAHHVYSYFRAEPGVYSPDIEIVKITSDSSGPDPKRHEDQPSGTISAGSTNPTPPVGIDVLRTKEGSE